MRALCGVMELAHMPPHRHRYDRNGRLRRQVVATDWWLVRWSTWCHRPAERRVSHRHAAENSQSPPRPHASLLAALSSQPRAALPIRLARHHGIWTFLCPSTRRGAPDERELPRHPAGICRGNPAPATNGRLEVLERWVGRAVSVARESVTAEEHRAVHRLVNTSLEGALRARAIRRRLGRVGAQRLDESLRRQPRRLLHTAVIVRCRDAVTVPGDIVDIGVGIEFPQLNSLEWVPAIPAGW
mmetsp:Transcript_28751/g.65123  ORF Transcript_28751/g.65123 Transcript_28751/m.65123 type:complete len:242 (+) Transcript_28751:618-1343(+)